MLVAALLFLGCNPAPDASGEAATQQFDIVFQGARVIDPERRLAEIRNVGIRGDTITALTEEPLADSLADGGVLIDASGLVLAPGFVDLHAHGQGPASREYQARDGVTTALELEWGVADVGGDPGCRARDAALRGLEIVPQGERAELERPTPTRARPASTARSSTRAGKTAWASTTATSSGRRRERG